MTVRLSFHQVMSRNRLCQIAAAAAIVFAVTAGAPGAQAATDDAASAPAEASAPLAAGSQYTIRPGQSLHDVAVAATQSHDRATLARASQALFEANPNAFMAHDPSRLRVGAVLTIPALDATGAAVPGAGASAASGASAGSAASVASASAPAQPATAASAASPLATAAQHGVPATVTAGSTPLQASAATASAAMAGVASTPSAGSAPASVAAAPALASAAAATAASASPVPQASGADVWTGAIQPSASAPDAGASAVLPSAPAAAAPVVQAPTKVSSLQQLLALKSRVLMELLKHGIGGTPVRPSQAGSAATAAGSQMAGVAAAASGASVPGNAGMANSHAAAAGNIDLSPENLGIPAAIGAVLVALLAGLGLRRRKRAAITREVPEAFPAGDTVEAHEDVAARERALADEVAAREAVAREVAEREAAAREAQAREAAEHEAAAREAAEHEALAREAEAHEAAARETAEREAAAREAAARDAALLGGAVSQASAGFPHDVAGHEPAADQGTAAPQEIASESRPSVAEGHQWDEATATPPEEIPSTEPVASFHPPQPQINFGAPPAEHDGEPNHGEALFEPEPNHPAAVTPPESHTPSEHHAFEPTPYADEAPHHSGTPTGASPDEPFTESPTEPAAPGEFPRDAVDAFGSLDLGLPPRIESPDTLTPPAPLATQPAVEPEISAQQTVAPQAAARRQVADEIAAGTAGAAAVTGLGAARFGALNLDFDLELPPSPAQPLPSFTPQDLVRIARNKLDLASEYIELGDLAGARALIHEVIEANDVATRTAARALLSTLAPLS